MVDQESILRKYGGVFPFPYGGFSLRSCGARETFCGCVDVDLFSVAAFVFVASKGLLQELLILVSGGDRNGDDNCCWIDRCE